MSKGKEKMLFEVCVKKYGFFLCILVVKGVGYGFLSGMCVGLVYWV